MKFRYDSTLNIKCKSKTWLLLTTFFFFLSECNFSTFIDLYTYKIHSFIHSLNCDFLSKWQLCIQIISASAVSLSTSCEVALTVNAVLGRPLWCLRPIKKSKCSALAAPFLYSPAFRSPSLHMMTFMIRPKGRLNIISKEIGPAPPENPVLSLKWATMTVSLVHNLMVNVELCVK